MKNKPLIIGIIIVLIAVVLIGGLTAYILANNVTTNNNENTNSYPNTAIQPPANTNTGINASISPTPKTYDVEIENFAFNPSSLTIKKGDSIRWTNRDSVDHTATADNGAFNSPLLSDDENFTFTFNEAGEFSYYCVPHPYMKAKIIVE